MNTPICKAQLALTASLQMGKTSPTSMLDMV